LPPGEAIPGTRDVLKPYARGETMPLPVTFSSPEVLVFMRAPRPDNGANAGILPTSGRP